MAEYVLDADTTAVLKFINANGEPFQYDLKQELAFSDATLRLDMEQQPAKYAWWASVLERARMKMKQTEDLLDYVKSDLSNKIRSSGEKKSVSAVTDEVNVSDDYQKVLADLRYWQGQVDMLQWVVKAYEQRERMLMQKSAQQRKLMTNESNRQAL